MIPGSKAGTDRLDQSHHALEVAVAHLPAGGVARSALGTGSHHRQMQAGWPLRLKSGPAFRWTSSRFPGDGSSFSANLVGAAEPPEQVPTPHEGKTMPRGVYIANKNAG